MKPPILFVHGMMQTGKCWDNYRAVFEAAGYDCHAPNLRYHNLHQKDAPDARLGDVSLRDYVADLKNLIAGLPTQPILVGHSMGGLIVQLLAAEGVGKAVIALTPAAPSNIFAFALSPLRVFSEQLFTFNFWSKPFKSSFAAASFGFLHQLSPEEQQKGYQELVHESGRALGEIGFPQFDKHKAAHVNVSAVQCPMLFVAGKLDRTTLASTIQRAAKLYPQAEYKEYEQFAHWILGEAGWEQPANDLLEWVKKIA